MMEQLSFACMNNTGLGAGKNEHLMWLRCTDLPAMPRPTKRAPDSIKRDQHDGPMSCLMGCGTVANDT